MKKTTITILILISLLLTSQAHAESTQQYNKIYLNPYYTNSFTSGTQQNYTLQVNPPDGLAKTITAIINFHAYILPSVSYNLTINNKTCNTNQYNVSTTQASAGVADVSFDCTNIINQTGTYNLTLTANKNTGATTAWLELTYMNQPSGTLALSGTEYIAGDLGKMFLQLLDTDKKPINNSECFLTIWYPNNTILANDTLMYKLNNATEGIYYHNFNVPNTTGVYPASAKCYKPLTFYNINLEQYAYDGFESGNTTGGTGWANDTGAIPNYGWDIEDTQPLSTIQTNSSTNPCYRGNYCAKYTGSYGYWERGVRSPNGIASMNISYAFRFKGFQTGETMEFWIFDGNWHRLKQYTKANYTNEVWYNETIYLDGSLYELDTILLYFGSYQTPSTGDEMWFDEVNISLVAPNISISNETQYEILRGSGEIHVSNLYNELINQLNNISVNVNVSFASVLNAISTASNLTTSQYQNLTQQINDLQNNMTLQYNNLTNQLNQVLNSTGNITNKIEQIYTLELYLNQTTTTTLNNLNTLNNTLYTQFNITNNLINEALNNLTQQINNLNTTTTQQINQSKNEIIQNIISINTTLNNQINNLNNTLTAQLTNLSNQILTQTNLTTAQYNNITNQINNLQNQMTSCCNNLSSQLANISINLTNLQNTANQILSAQAELNQTTQTIYSQIIALNQTIITQFNLTNTLIYNTYLNLTTQLDLQYNNINGTLTNLTNITSTNQNWLIMIWNYLTGYLTNLTLQINSTTTNNSIKLDALLTPTINIATQDNTPCYEGSTWTINATTTGSYGQLLTNNQANCTINTTTWGIENMTYLSTGKWQYTNTCPPPTNWTWSITCI